MHQIEGVYTFDISAGATKRDIKQAVKSIYKVTPRKVAVVTVRSKNVRSARSGKSGVKSGGRKAYVFLKKGDTITF
jgi:large subunit ribosomal protein L23